VLNDLIRRWDLKLWLVAASILASTQACGMTAEDIERVTPEALKAAIDNKDAVAVDVRNSTAWYTGHIMGAHWIYYYEIEERALDELPADKLIITYCS
jgi:predicted sulfurtransferase